jgi:hypothetical protein
MNTDTQSNELTKPRTGLDSVYDEKVRELLKSYDHHKSAGVFIKRLAAVYKEVYGVEGDITAEMQQEAIDHLSFENLEQIYINSRIIRIDDKEEKEND